MPADPNVSSAAWGSTTEHQTLMARLWKLWSRATFRPPKKGTMFALMLLDHGDLIHEYQSCDEALAALERVEELEPERAQFAAVVEIKDGHVVGEPITLAQREES